ncbi:MAG: hypothetical protein HC836_33185 [Richelia sp. RM2_1_2]|nr:hypothetical protein [Richelia sp. RM2_1_2]
MSKTKAPDTLTIKPSELALALMHLSKVKNRKGGVGRAAFIWGPPGIGKSDIMAQVAADLGFQFVDIRLSQMEPTDVRGIPVPSKGQDGTPVVFWAPPSFLELDPSVPTMYFFDEMNSAPQSIQSAAYQFILDRRLGDHKFGPHDVVFAAGNRETDRGATFKMPTPLMNRFVHLELRVDFDDWQNWAIANSIHKTVVGYLTWQKHELFDFQPGSASRGFPTPRSWEFVSQLVNEDPNLPEMVILAMISGSVGEGAAIKFMEYRKLNEKLPNPSDILAGKITKLKDDQKETSIMYALTIGLCYELKEKYDAARALESQDGGKAYDAWVGLADNFFAFMMENFQPEMTILGARTILSNFRLRIAPTKMKSWKPFAQRHNSLILEN